MDFEVNALGTLNVLEAVRAIVPSSAVIYSSTNKVYGDLEQYQYLETDTRYVCVEHPAGFNEETPLGFHSPYGCSKGAADQYLLDYNRIFGMKTVVFRHSSMYGGRQFATEDQGWIGWFCQMAAQTSANQRKELFTISGSGKQVRDVLHADDMISLYFSTLRHAEAAAGQAFNIGGGISNSLSLLELFAVLEQRIGQPLRYNKRPPRGSDQKVFVADISRISKLTGWVPRVNAPTGVSRMFDWTTASMSLGG
jgi:CDP-paratose 2-epimerase